MTGFFQRIRPGHNDRLRADQLQRDLDQANKELTVATDAVFELRKELDDQRAKPALYCSFCGKSQHDVLKLIAGPNVFICDECVVTCVKIFAGQVK